MVGVVKCPGFHFQKLGNYGTFLVMLGAQLDAYNGSSICDGSCAWLAIGGRYGRGIPGKGRKHLSSKSSRYLALQCTCTFNPQGSAISFGEN